jgi:phosphoribosylformimino-5-aminoimidazole carboxamide ribotide isomerase
MYIIPAIDLISGKCVRLIQGEYDREITYEENPVRQARQFISDGAEWLHIVDLDGARMGRPVNIEPVRAIAELGQLKIELGGGIRDKASVTRMLDMGLERVIIGTKAVKDFNWFSQIASEFNGRIVLGLDARGAKLASDGWTQDTAEEVIEFAKQAAKLPIAAIIYTDISKDGMLAGPNLERTKAVADAVNIPVIAAGGVSSTEDIQKLAKAGVAGAIIGRALYEGRLTLTKAIKTSRECKQSL